MPLNESHLAGFIGTEGYTRWSPLFPRMVLTDGALHVAKNGGTSGAFWLMDAIASYQPQLRKHKWAQEIQFWELVVTKKDDEHRSAVLTCTQDSGIKPTVRQEIEYTDFDLPSIKFYVQPLHDGKGTMVILLSSEY
jgi:hypothetical protein